MRAYITKSRSGHYTATIRDERGVLVHVDWGLATLEDARRAARAALAKAKGERAGMTTSAPTRADELDRQVS